MSAFDEARAWKRKYIRENKSLWEKERDTRKKEGEKEGLKSAEEVLKKLREEELILDELPPRANLHKQWEILKANLEHFIQTLKGVLHGLTSDGVSPVSREIEHFEKLLKDLGTDEPKK